MNKRARELDQPFVESIIGTPALPEPKFFEDIVRFIKKLLIETGKITEVMRVLALALAALDQRGNLRAFFTHGPNIKRAGESGKKVSSPATAALRGLREFQ